jgi:hypothetical protein
VGSDIGVENFDAPDNVYGVIANPVCTEFSTARAGGKSANPDQGMELVNECRRVIGQCDDLKFWVIENPARGDLKKYLGKPTYQYQPWWYGSPWTKDTGLWGEFNIPQRIYSNWDSVPKNESLYVRPGRPKPSLAILHKSSYHLIPEFQVLPEPATDAEFRSMCSQKFANAFFEANR